MKTRKTTSPAPHATSTPQTSTAHIPNISDAADELLRMLWAAYHRGGVTVFQIAPGVGKTRAALAFVQALRSFDPDQRIRFASPTRDLAQETATAAGRAWDVRASRNEATCAQFDHIERWMRLGLGSKACGVCPRHPRGGMSDACATPDRLRQTGGATHTTHAHLWLTGVREGEVVVIDEDPTSTALTTHHIPYRHLSTVLRMDGWAAGVLDELVAELGAVAEGTQSGPALLDRSALLGAFEGAGDVAVRPFDEGLYAQAAGALETHGDAPGVLDGIEQATPPRYAWEALEQAWAFGGAWYGCTLTPTGLDVTAPELLGGVAEAKAVFVLDGTADVDAARALWGELVNVVEVVVPFPDGAEVWLVPQTLSTQQHHNRKAREALWGVVALAKAAGFAPDTALFVGHKRHTPRNAATTGVGQGSTAASLASTAATAPSSTTTTTPPPAAAPAANTPFTIPPMPDAQGRGEAWAAEFEALVELGCAWTHLGGTLARGSNAWEGREAVFLATWATPRAAWVARGEALRWAASLQGVELAWAAAWEAARWSMLVAPVAQAGHRIRQMRTRRSLTVMFCDASAAYVAGGDAPPRGLVDVAAAAAGRGLLPTARVICPDLARALATGYWSGRAAVGAAEAAAEVRGWCVPGVETAEGVVGDMARRLAGGLEGAEGFCARVPNTTGRSCAKPLGGAASVDGAPAYGAPADGTPADAIPSSANTPSDDAAATTAEPPPTLAELMRRTRAPLSRYPLRTSTAASTGNERRLELVRLKGPTGGRPQAALTDSHTPVDVEAIARVVLAARPGWAWVEVCGVRVERAVLDAAAPSEPVPSAAPPSNTAPSPPSPRRPPLPMRAPSRTDHGMFALWLLGDDVDGWADDPDPPPDPAGAGALCADTTDASDNPSAADAAGLDTIHHAA